MGTNVSEPIVAAWLINMFAPDDHSEAVVGDLSEEFAHIAWERGFSAARRWYWWQALRTIFHFITGAFRVAPWSSLGVLIGGFFLLQCGFGFGLAERAVVALLDFRQQAHVTPYLTWAQAQSRIFWLVNGVLVGNLLISLSVGCLVAVFSKGRELVTTTALGFVLSVWNVFFLLSWSGSGRHEWHVPTPLAFLIHVVMPTMLIQLASPTMIVLGGVLVRTNRLGPMTKRTPG